MSRVTAKELLAWGDLEARRRRQSRGPLGLLSWPPFVAVALSILLGLDLWRRLHATDGNIGPFGFALTAIAFAQILVVFATPYRMYWRHDSALLARLSIDGGSLFSLAVTRSVRAAALAFIPALVAAAVIGSVTAEVGLRLAVVGLASAVLAGMLAPAACLLGGAIVASDRAQAMIDSLAGDAKPPGVTWLGALPGFVAMAVALLAIEVRHWAAALEPLASRSLAFLVAAVLGSIGALAWAIRAAPRVLIDAQREVAALDQERLAHIDRSLASPLERAWAALTARSPSAKAIYAKDAALMRRRYPAPYFVAFLGIVAAWILAATSQPLAALVIVASLAVYALFMARRQAISPVEIPRLLRALPLSRGGVRAAKRSAMILRSLVWVALPGAALLVFADDLTASLSVPLAALAVALIVGNSLAVEREAR